MSEKTNSDFIKKIPDDKVVEALVKDYRDDAILLIELGFIAIKQSDEMNALRLFSAAQLLNLKSVAPLIGMGYIAIHKTDTKGAREIFQKVLKIEPENELANVFLQMCSLIDNTNVKTAHKNLVKLNENSVDETTKTFCTSLIKWCEKDPVKKQQLAI